MITALTALALLQQGSLFGMAFPNPTGDNGLEEYYRAFDVVATYVVHPSVINRQSLSSDQEAYKQFGRACDLVRAGNRKPLTSNPKDVVKLFAGPLYEKVGSIFVAEARLRAAGGRPDEAAESIMALLTFARRMPSASIGEALSATAVETQALSALEYALPKLSSDGAANLSKFVLDLCEQPSPFRHAYLENSKYYREIMANSLRNKSSPDYLDPIVPKELQAAGPEEVERFVSAALQLLDRHDAAISAMFEKEERFWKTPEPATDDPVMLFAFRGHGMSFTLSAVRSRTQLRLAALHCRIIEFKRTYNGLPTALTELGGGEVGYDPASGGPYFYARPTEQSYVLYSLGTSETGRIDLVPRRALRGAQ